MIHDNCNGTDSVAPNGFITSPNHPNKYPPSTDCYIALTAPHDSILKLSVQELDTENCIYDYLQVSDGDNYNSKKIATLCGRNQPNQKIYSTTDSLYLRFITDGGTEYKGFKIRYEKQQI